MDFENLTFNEEPYIVLDVAMGKLLGVEKAIILRKIYGWLKYNIQKRIDPKKDKNFHSGKYWCFNSLADWENDIQVLDKYRIRRHLKALEADGWIQTGNFNKRRSDKTIWYTIDWAKFFAAFPHFGKFEDKTDQIEQSKLDKKPDKPDEHPLQNETSCCDLQQAVAICNNVTNSITQLTEPNYHKPSTVGLKKPPKVIDSNDNDLDLAKKWLEMSVENMKWEKPPAKWTIKNFAIDISKLRRSMNFTDEGMTRVFDFINSSKFWSENCLSPSRMLKKNDEGVRKIDTILLRMRPKEYTEMAKIAKWDNEKVATPF